MPPGREPGKVTEEIAMPRQKIDLPAHVYTVKNLAESGIRFPPPVLDTAAREGPGVAFRITGVLAIMFIVFSCTAGLLGSFPESGVTVLRVIGLLFCMDAGFRFFRWFRYIRIRQKILSQAQGVPAEPLALVLQGNPETVSGQLSAVRSIIAGKRPRVAVVYKETGTKKPKFYITPYRTVQDWQLPSGTALLYRHHSREHYYVIEDDFDFIKSRSPAGIFSGAVSPADF